LAECGRVLASVPLLGHLAATAILDSGAGSEADLAELLRQLGEGETRAAFAPARPPGDLVAGWTGDPLRGNERAPVPTADRRNGKATISGAAYWVPDIAGADLIVISAVDSDGIPLAALVERDAAGVTTDAVVLYDGTRTLGHLRLDDVSARVLTGVGDRELQAAWFLAHALIAAESTGAVEASLELAVAYAKERYAFGRAIGSYQSIKHQLVEVLRLLENSRSLLYYAGWAQQDAPDEFPLAASAARVAAAKAHDYASRALISVHGGIGATWEHDAPLYFRRAQLSRRLLGGASDAADRVAGELLAQAATKNEVPSSVPNSTEMVSGSPAVTA
jgi:alkylation response protein AidB-like acyl-CoA dehydrogenase